MNPTRVIHTADTHIGYTQYHNRERERDFLDAFENVIDDAIEQDVDAVIHAGDLFHNSNPDPRALHGTIEELKRLNEAGVRFLGIVGNHEGTNDREWIDLFEKLGIGERLDNTPTVVGDTAFYGLDHIPETRRQDLSYHFETSDTEYTALVGHGQFTPLTPGSWDAEEVLSKSNLAFDAFLLGDDHKRQITELNGTVTTYPGSTERTAADQDRDRVYNLVTFGVELDDYEASVKIDWEAIDTRQFVYLQSELAADEGTATIREKLSNRAIEDAVVIVEVKGDGSNIQPAEIEEYGKEQGAFIVRVYDRREFEESDGSVDVDFADPESAARERLSEMDLTEATYELEQEVRTDSVPSSKLPDHTEDEVDNLIEERPEAFEKPASITETDEESGETEATEDSEAEEQNEKSEDGSSASRTDGGSASATQDSDSPDETGEESISSSVADAESGQVTFDDL